ncbi:MAG TPA: hypothetical protein VGL81_07600 [Polyangiaceae bacterium]|jgi:hypothetical protein
MTRFEPETPAPRPAAEVEEDACDSLFERWLAHSSTSRARLRSGVPAPAPAPREEPLGDDLADSWFK